MPPEKLSTLDEKIVVVEQIRGCQRPLVFLIDLIEFLIFRTRFLALWLLSVVVKVFSFRFTPRDASSGRPGFNCDIQTLLDLLPSSVQGISL